MSLQLYGATYSVCTQRVLLVLEELKLPYQLVHVDMMKGDHKVADISMAVILNL